MTRILCWFSCGAASAVATKLTVNRHPEAIPVYCATGSEHPDNERFLADCERWFGKSVLILKSETYSSTWDVWEKTGWLAGIEGARCTSELKFAQRLAFQRPDDVHVFGYTADKADAKRAANLRANFPELQVETPLIDAGLIKESVLDMVLRGGIALPPLYALGFPHNNCIPCVKATSPAYWALVRKHFPDEFGRIAKLARTLGVRLARLEGERIFIEEIPIDHPTTNPMQPQCDFLCAISELELSGGGR